MPNGTIDESQRTAARIAGVHYDLILDSVGNHSLLACGLILNPKGIYIAVGGPSGRWMIGFLVRAITSSVFSRFMSQKLVTVLMRRSKEDLTMMQELMATGKVTPVIDRRYSLGEVPEAIRYLEEGHARGKVVITFEKELAERGAAILMSRFV